LNRQRVLTRRLIFHGEGPPGGIGKEHKAGLFNKARRTIGRAT
jgi:hypothetical protein